MLLKPVRRNPQTGQAERLLSFTYAYQTADGGAATSRTTATHNFAQTSVLSSGDWYKIGVPRNGVYKLDLATLQKLGLPASVDPNKVQLYGNATGLLPQANATPRPDDLVENNLYFRGQYRQRVWQRRVLAVLCQRAAHLAGQPAGRGRRPWSQPGLYGLLGEGGRFKHLNNFLFGYSLLFRAGGHQLMASALPTAAAPGQGSHRARPSPTFLDRRFYEHDLVNVLRSGRRWLGESFTNSTNPSRDFTIQRRWLPRR